MLKTHLTILGIFALLVIPVYLVDQWLLKPQRGSSFLDLSGLFILLYLAFLTAQIVISSLGFCLFKPRNMASLHIISAFVSVLVIGGGIYAIESYHSLKRSEAHQEKMSSRTALYDDVILEKWWYLPEMEEPETVFAEFSFKRNGRFSAYLTARAVDENSDMKFWAEMERSIFVKRGDRRVIEMAVEQDQPGPAHFIQLNLFLFSENPDHRESDITKIYLPKIDQQDDGKMMYAILPERSTAPDQD